MGDFEIVRHVVCFVVSYKYPYKKARTIYKISMSPCTKSIYGLFCCSKLNFRSCGALKKVIAITANVMHPPVTTAR